MTSPPGFYGKVPVLGDFVSRRLPPSFISRWDEWLSRCLSASRAQVGENWLRLYLTSPVWRFALGPGLCGELGWVGVMIPSVDRAGRYFPLTLAGAVEAGVPLTWPSLDGDDWLEALEGLALSALGDHFDLADFDRALRDHPLPSHAEAITEQPALPGSTGAPAAEAGPMLRCGGHSIPRPGAGCSLWVAAGSGGAPAHGLCWEGLPPESAFAAMLGDPDSLAALLQDGWNLPLPIAPAGRVTEAATAEPMLWQAAVRSETGHRRAINEDAWLMRPEAGFWAVADGMGGHESGDFASRQIMSMLATVKSGRSLHALLARVQAALDKANRAIRDFARQKGVGAIVGSTVVVFMARGDRGCVTWAGDSRLYRYRAGQLEQLTRDHAWNEPAPSGPDGAPPAARRSNVITRAVGAYAELKLDTAWLDVRPGDLFLLCTDGLDKELDPADIAGLLARRAPPQATADALITAALERGGRDNVTVVVVNRNAAGLGSPEVQPSHEEGVQPHVGGGPV